MNITTHQIHHTDAIVIGSGAAGLSAALELAPKSTVLLTKTDGLPGGSSQYAQGGIAAAMAQDDSPFLHAQDTMSAGAGLNVLEMVNVLTEEGPERMLKLLKYGMPFDKDEAGNPSPQKEAAHCRSRVLHAKGDSTGRVLVDVLVQAVEACPSIEVHTQSFAWDLIVEGDRVTGVLAWNQEEGWTVYQAGAVILATGGIGQVFSVTTNPAEATGDGLAMAWRAGAACTDLEFVQFHPTALAAETRGANVPLLTEALRGEGAHLLNHRGERFMVPLHEDAELAPRDIVARAVWSANQEGPVYLDAREAVGAEFPTRFPTVYQLCKAAGLDPVKEPIPVAPAVHYHMGGVLTDVDGKTTLSGLWACGEVASTGVHGANRLASNSLLECLVFARRVAEGVKTDLQDINLLELVAKSRSFEFPQVHNPVSEANPRKALQELMYESCGLVRSANSLERGLDALQDLHCGGLNMQELGEFANLKTVGHAVLYAALQREESRGAHFREDFPITRDTCRSRQILSKHDMLEESVATVAQTA